MKENFSGTKEAIMGLSRRFKKSSTYKIKPYCGLSCSVVCDTEDCFMLY